MLEHFLQLVDVYGTIPNGDRKVMDYLEHSLVSSYFDTVLGPIVFIG